MKKRLIPCILVTLIITSLLAGCGKAEEIIMPSPSAPDITLYHSYSQTELEAAVNSAGGGCDIGTLTISDNGDGTYTIECNNQGYTATATGNIDIVQPEYESARCQFEIPQGQTVECGYLTVPEDRSQPDGPTIRLHVAIFESPSNNPAPDPIVYLEGGPGGNALEAMSLTFNKRFAPFLEDRDLIVFDPRGTGLSEPALDCPELIDLTYELLDQDLSPEESAVLGNEAALQCRDRLLSEGVNLEAYNSAESAADLNDLRLALGYEEWNLFGISYGTRLALTALRDYPEGIRSVILDSAYPLRVNLYTALPDNLDRAFNVFFDGCAADPVCNKAYPGLETVFYELVEQLNESPITFPARQPISEETYDILVNGDGLIGFLFKSLYSTELIPLLPMVIYDIHEGNYETLALLEGSFLADMEFISTGMYYSVQCGEEVHFTTPEEFATAYSAYPELRDFFYDVFDPDEGICAFCEAWGAKEADPIENKPVSSDIPVLVLAGEYDPITPPAWGSLVAETLSNDFYYEFPGVGHGASISGEECPLSIALAFLNDPTGELVSSCLAQMSGPTYVTREISLVPFTDVLLAISGVVPEGWEQLSPGTYARSSLGLTVILQQAAQGIKADVLLQLLADQLDLYKLPDSVGSRQANNLQWSLYEFMVNGLVINLAIAEDEWTSYLVLLQSLPGERDFYYTEVFLPAVDGLTPD